MDQKVKAEHKIAPVLIVFGQSNAHGHGTLLQPQDRITKPLTNVLGLARAENQSYDITDVVWSGFVTEGMNLGETQDNTCCLAGEFARKWEEASQKEKDMPPLYIIQISIGCMGIDLYEKNGINMWAADRAPVIRPGRLGEVDISLYPLAVHILALAMKSLEHMGKMPSIIGLHWNQWETEVDTGGEVLMRAEDNYRRLFEGFRSALGYPCPVYLYKPLSDVYQNPEGVARITEVFEKIVGQCEDFHMVDLTSSNMWDPSRPDKGIFQNDCVHYHMDAHRWFAEEQFKRISKSLFK